MKRINYLAIMIVFLAGLLLSACGGQISVTSEKEAPSKLEPIEGSELSRVILTEKAAKRIGVETVPASGETVPYSAVIYDTEGQTWVYTSPAPLTYVRVPILIDHIDGDQVFLSQALETEAPIVTVGVIEIYGAETGVSK
jgi:hypothetical protein